MIIQELAYKITVKADEFLNGKKKVEEGAKELSDTVNKELEGIGDTTNATGKEITKTGDEIQKANKKAGRSFSDTAFDIKNFTTAATTSFRGVTVAAAGFLGIGAGLYGIKQLFTSTSNEIVMASNQARFFGSDVNKMFGMRRGFQQAGLNGDAFISASGNARMALANIADPTVFGGLTGSAQNLIVMGARTGLNINRLGDPNKALAEFTRYGKSHSQENLMQVMSATGFDPTDAAKIKSGELKSLVDSETKKSNITAQQVKEQENLLVTLGQLDAEFDRIRLDLAMAFAPEVMTGLKTFGDWIKEHHGDIIGFFRDAGDKVKAFTDAVGGAENALKILAGLYVGSKVLGASAGGSAAAGAAGLASGKGIMGFLGRLGLLGAGIYNSPEIADATTPESILQKSDRDRPFIYQKYWANRLLNEFFGTQFQEDDDGRSSSYGTNKDNNPGNLRASGSTSGFRSFSSEQEGWDAMTRQLMMYFNGTSAAAGNKKLRTVKDIISTWAPSSENDTDSYIKEVASYMGVGSTDQLNLADPTVMAKLRSAMARREGFKNWQNGLQMGGANQFQNEYYLQQQKLAETRPANTPSTVDNSRSSSTHIAQVVVNSNPKTVDALTRSVEQQARRSSTNGAFSSANHN
ncbi:lytic transglycosylase domain-containing protein [Escherichia coli]|nr:lytic transglycosylase domain-containing protein [Escherichia coli]